MFDLNPAATAIWQAADGQTPLAEIVERKICVEFDVDPGEALRDAEEFAREGGRQDGVIAAARRERSAG